MLDMEKKYCPYCGEPIELLIDESAGSQEYIEDCQVCCRPIEINVEVGTTGAIDITLQRDSD